MHRLLLLLSILANLASQIFPLNHPTSPDDPHFIVVGAGTSGCALTALLCEYLPSARILLLDRSSPRGPDSELNVRAARNVFDAWVDLNVSSHLVTRGTHSSKPLLAISPNTFGGGSAVNAGQFFSFERGTFSKQYGIIGLNDERALEILQKNVLPKVKPSMTSDTVADNWIEAAHRIGMKKIDNNIGQIYENQDASFNSLSAFDQTGRRRDSCTSYETIEKCGSRLEIIQKARVDSLIFDKKKTSRGRKIIRGVKLNSNKRFNAIHEVILAAGPYESPKLLQLSGIGPKDVLQKAGIEVKHNLPVGRYAQAKAATAVLSVYKGAISRNNDERLHSPRGLEESRKTYLNGSGSGILSLRIGNANGRFAGLAEITMTTGFPITMKFPGERLFDRKVVRSTCVLDSGPDVFSPISVISGNSSYPPYVEFNALRSRRDRLRMVKCIERLRNLHEEMSITETEILPDKSTNLENYVMERSQNGQHYVGGCAIGKVLNNKTFQVKGMNGLRVVDASAIPSMPKGAGPMSSVYIIAEYAASVIANKYRLVQL